MTKKKSVIPQDNRVIRIFAIYQATFRDRKLESGPGKNVIILCSVFEPRLAWQSE